MLRLRLSIGPFSPLHPRFEKLSLVSRCLILVSLVLACLASTAAWGAPLVLERTIELHDVSGRIDHMAVDLKRGRLFVAELANNTVDVIDIMSGKSIRRLTGFGEPQGIGYSVAADRVAVADARDGTVRFYEGEDFAPAGSVSLGEDADDIRTDAKGNFVVGYGSGGIALLDPIHRSVISRLSLPAHPEGFQLAPSGRKLFVNVPDAERIVALDTVTGAATSWRPHGLASNFPMALDASGRTVAIV